MSDLVSSSILTVSRTRPGLCWVILAPRVLSCLQDSVFGLSARPVIWPISFLNGSVVSKSLAMLKAVFPSAAVIQILRDILDVGVDILTMNENKNDQREK